MCIRDSRKTVTDLVDYSAHIGTDVRLWPQRANEEGWCDNAGHWLVPSVKKTEGRSSMVHRLFSSRLTGPQLRPGDCGMVASNKSCRESGIDAGSLSHRSEPFAPHVARGWVEGSRSGNAALDLHQHRVAAPYCLRPRWAMKIISGVHLRISRSAFPQS